MAATFCSKQRKQFFSKMKVSYIIIISTVYLISFVLADNKYSEQANVPKFDPHEPITYTNFRTLEKPFRMAKLNVLWSKAQLRLSDVKLKSLYSELKIHDKEEIVWKKLKAEGHDKDGLKEADLRSKLTGVMSTYGLLHHFEDVTNPEKVKEHRFDNNNINKSMFQDHRLNHLWDKAEKAGFTAEELQALKEEFLHHQEKVDQYYSLLNNVSPKSVGKEEHHENTVADDLDKFNSLTESEAEDQFHEKTKLLRDVHKDVKDGYDRLYRITAKGPKAQEFIEPQVQGLWKIAVKSNFTDEELLSLKSELLHYENRLLKLRHLHAEAAANADRDAKKKDITKQLSEGMKMMEDNIKKSSRKVEKIRMDLEAKIMQKHIEL